jgi:hypothetical protein
LEPLELLEPTRFRCLRVLPAFAGFVTFLITALLSFFVAILIVFLLGLLISLSVTVGVSTIVCFGGRWWG